MPDCSLLNSIAEQSTGSAISGNIVLSRLSGDCLGLGRISNVDQPGREVGQELEQFSASSFIHQIESQTLHSSPSQKPKHGWK